MGYSGSLITLPPVPFSEYLFGIPHCQFQDELLMSTSSTSYFRLKSTYNNVSPRNLYGYKVVICVSRGLVHATYHLR